jgi:hemoglobin
MGNLDRRFVECSVAAVDEAGLPAEPEFRAALRAYMQWAVDDVLAFSVEEAVVPGGLPMPRCRGTAFRKPPRR